MARLTYSHDPTRCSAAVQEAGLKVLLRPGPCERETLGPAHAPVASLGACSHRAAGVQTKSDRLAHVPAHTSLLPHACPLADICAEWDNGGFPHWFASSKVRWAWHL